MLCLICKAPGTWYCSACEEDHEILKSEIKAMTRYLGDDYREGPLILKASAILEAYERVENTTALGKAAIDARARELLLEVEDAFMYSPWCPKCKEHKLELITGDPIRVTCTGDCKYGNHLVW